MKRGTAAALLLIFLHAAAAAAGPAPAYVPPTQSIRGIVFDPSDYYATGMSVNDLAAMLVARWSRYGVNVVYMNAYNVVFGAHYRTAYPYNRMDAFGRSDLLRAMITEAHRREIQVFAAFYSHTHRGAWIANPSWRAKRADGSDYTPAGVDVQYFLSVWNPQVVAWWTGLLEEILTNYPELDGIELREPVINWWGTDADFNEAATRAFRLAFPGQPLRGATWRRWRAEGLTSFIARTVRLVHLHRRRIHITSVGSAWGNGRLMTSREQADQTGFDLDGVLTAPAVPDALKIELIWQQWGNVYDYVTFSPEWTGRAAAAALRMVAGRTRAVVHVELTDFGRRAVTPQETYLAMRAARQSGAVDFDVYGARLADRKASWPWLQRAFTEHDPPPIRHARGQPVRHLLVLEDVDRDRSGIPRLATSLLVNLLGHFDVVTEVRAVADYRRGSLDDYDGVIYQGTEWDALLPPALLNDLGRYAGPVLWIGANLWQLTRAESIARFGLRQQPPVPQYAADTFTYRGVTVAAHGLPVLGVEVGPAAAVRGRAVAGGRRLPLVVQSDRFWFVAGHLFPAPERNPLQWVVADLLHDILQTAHSGEREALLVIDGITPLTDPAQLAGLRRALAGKIPLVLAVTPVFVDPVTQLRITLRERPALVDELRRSARTGTAVVLNGYTHQFRGRTGQDYEFWDVVSGTALPEDSAELIEGRVRLGLREMLAAGLVPVAWATPGGLASPFDYTLFGGMFSLQVERRFYGFSDSTPVRQRFPYAVRTDLHGHTVLSPNVDLDRQQALEDALEEAMDLQIVRDALAVAAVPVSTAPAMLAGLVEGLSRQGYRFRDLRAFGAIEIRTPDLAIVSQGGKIRLLVDEGSFVTAYDLGADGRRTAGQTLQFGHAQRFEDAPALPPGTVRVVEVVRVTPWSAGGIRLRARILAAPLLDLWAQRDVAGGVRLLAVILSLLSAAIVVSLGISHVLVRLTHRSP